MSKLLSILICCIVFRKCSVSRKKCSDLLASQCVRLFQAPLQEEMQVCGGGEGLRQPFREREESGTLDMMSLPRLSSHLLCGLLAFLVEV